MIDTTLVLIGITVLFALLIAFRSVFSLKVCALCGAVSVTWLTLLILFYLDYVIDPVLVALLIGGSVVGSMYLLEQKLPEKYQLFKLPYFLMFVSLAYFVVTKSMSVSVMVLLGVVWLIALLIHVGGRVEKLKIVGRKIIECCKNW